jgi:cell wall-associated NlpC family hydrolase
MAESAYDDLIGRPFAKAGRGPDVFDCYGLVREMYARKGVTVPNYSTGPDAAPENAQILSGMTVWKKVDERPYVAVVFRLLGKLHIGYLLPYGKMIHCWERSGGVCVERFDTWRNKVIGYYDY